jgi:hypothetical protein
MASKSNFIGEFRQAVAQMLASYNKALDLAEEADMLGWDATTLAGEFTSSDITVTEFVTAMSTIKDIETANAGIAGDLIKLKA